MDDLSRLLITELLVVAWLLLPLIVIQYRLTSVQNRMNEVQDAFIGRDPGKKQDGQSIDVVKNRIPAWCYLKALRPLEAQTIRGPLVTRAKLMEPIREQFDLLQGGRKYALSLGLVMLASAFDLSVCHAWAMHSVAALARTPGSAEAPFVVAPWVPDSLQFAPMEVIAALVGAYVWSLYEIISRRAMRDLTADELYPIAFRLLTAVPIGLAFANLVPNAGIKSAVAFASTAFPFRDVNQLIRQMVVREAQRDSLGTDARRARGYLGATLQGFGHDTTVRLEELGIVTVLDMAYADPVCLMFKTGAPLRQVITWLDESLLAVYAGPLTAKFAALGVPCSIDVSDIWQRHQRASTEQEKKLVTELAASLGLEQSVLEDLLRRVERDPQVQFIVSVWEAGETVQVAATPAATPALAPAQA